MSSSHPPAITRDLSRRENEDHREHLDRVAHQHRLPGQGKPRLLEGTVAPSEPYEPTAEEIERVAVAREASLKKLAPKQKARRR